MCSAEVRPVAGRSWEPGPPSPQSIELGRVVDRGIRESGCIDVDDFDNTWERGLGKSYWTYSLYLMMEIFRCIRIGRNSSIALCNRTC